MNESYIPADQNLPEVTIKACVLSIILTVMLTASTVYLGLKVGITISASIPAAIISMGILGFFRKSNILENNIVQTTVSGGMSLASGVIFCLPALVILSVWQDFEYWETFTITLYGGILGVFFAIPFRKTLLNDKELHFPEGTAIGYVLKAKSNNKNNLSNMLKASFIGAGMSFAQIGLKVISEGVDLWFKAGKTLVGTTLGFSPVLLGAGYIIGSRTAFTILFGIIIAWVIGIPWLSMEYGIKDEEYLLNSAMYLWSNYIRYIGVGVLLVGGFSTFFDLIKPFVAGYKHSKKALDQMKNNGSAKSTKKTFLEIPRTERDIPLKYVLLGCLAFVVPLFFAFENFINTDTLSISVNTFWQLNCSMVVYVLIGGFIFSAVCGYIVGLVGSSASPLSAIALAAIIIGCIILLSIFGGYTVFQNNPDKALAASTLAIVIGVVIICSAAITNDTIQDLKVGAMVGATPWKLQLMTMAGVVIAALIIPPILHLLFNAYGIGNVFPREGMDPSNTLAAPQAQLMAAIANGVFNQNVPWPLIGIGAAIAAATIIVNIFMKAKGRKSFSVIAVGMGIYLPIFAATALVIGGIIEYFSSKKLKQLFAKDEAKIAEHQQSGFILCSGLIAGGAIMGIILAIPFVISQDTNVLAIVSDDLAALPRIFSLVVALWLCSWMYKKVTQG